MSLSALSLPESDIPPWGWNPAATFQASFLAAREEERAQQEFQMKAELDKILFPAKKAQAEFTLKQLTYESERMAKSYQLLNEETDERRRILRSGGSGASSNVAGNGGSDPNTPSVGRWSAARYVGQPTQTSTPVVKPKTKPTWSVVQPAATSSGP